MPAATHRSSFFFRSRAWAVGALAAALLAGCGDDAKQAQGGGAGAAGAGGGAPPPAQVGVVTVQPTSVGLANELPGRVEALRVAQVRARAAGILQKRLFEEGSDVKAGQVLFLIDAAPYQAALQSAQATLARAQANLAQYNALVERNRPLVEANAISKQEFLNTVTAQKQAEADVAAGKAAVQTAQINLGYARVTAPISGRIGRALVTEGALVGQGEVTQLAVIQQIHPIYVNVTQPASEVLRLRKAVAAGQYKRAGGQGASVKVMLDDGSVYPHAGRLLFSDLSVDPTSGQIVLRAEVPNPDGLLLPGMYVRAQLEQAKVDGAILLPQQAVTRSAQGDTVMVVDGQGKVSPRPVKLGPAQGNHWVVLDGLKTGEQVMVDGFQKVKPNATVKAVPWQAPGSAPAQGGSAPAGAAAASGAAR